MVSAAAVKFGTHKCMIIGSFCVVFGLLISYFTSSVIQLTITLGAIIGKTELICLLLTFKIFWFDRNLIS